MRKLVWLILIGVLAASGWFAWAVLTPTEPSGQTFVMLHPGFSTHRIAAELKSAGLIRSEEAFVLWHYLNPKRSLKAGEYLFDKPANIIDIQKRLRRGDVYFHTVVVPEGFTMFDIARAVEAAGLGPADDFLKVAQSDTAMIADIAPECPFARRLSVPGDLRIQSHDDHGGDGRSHGQAVPPGRTPDRVNNRPRRSVRYIATRRGQPYSSNREPQRSSIRP